ncbi:MAG: sortase [Candidatus Dojkabacteria bacterium]|nr:MAG: sortase [Candidatus Dojkabacteria bacterium]
MLPILPKTALSSQEKRVKYTEKSKQSNTQKLSVLKGLSKFVIIGGLLLLVTQLLPLGVSYAQSFIVHAYNGETYIPVSQNFLQKMISVQYIDPGQAYFQSVVDHQRVQDITIDTSYTQPMNITVGTAEINNILLTPNVPGSDKSLYEAALKKGVAHLKGTPLPGSGGTSIIYGHSGLSGLLVSPHNPQIIFSRLDAANVGDTVTIHRDGKELQYLVTSKKIIEPTDVTFITDTSHKEKIVLITCWPLGIGTKRLVLIGEKIQ